MKIPIPGESCPHCGEGKDWIVWNDLNETPPTVGDILWCSACGKRVEIVADGLKALPGPSAFRYEPNANPLLK